MTSSDKGGVTVEPTYDQMADAAALWQRINHAPWAIRELAVALAERCYGCEAVKADANRQADLADSELSRLRSRLATLEKEMARLTDAGRGMTPFTRHGSECRTWKPHSNYHGACDCGFVEALGAFAEAIVAAESLAPAAAEAGKEETR